MENVIDVIGKLPAEPWGIRESAANGPRAFLHETLFALGNGYIGMRGTHEEGGAQGPTLEGTYLNGFYENEAIHYPENAYGLARTNEFMLNVPNAKRIALTVDGERFGFAEGRLLAYERSLDFRHGVLERTLEWESPRGRRVRIESRRLVCFGRKHVAALEYKVTALNFSGQVEIASSIDAEVTNLQAGDDPRVGSAVTGPALSVLSRERGEGGELLLQRTRNSGFLLATGVLHACSHPSSQGQDGAAVFSAALREGESITLHKYIAYVSSRDVPEAEVPALARAELGRAAGEGFAVLVAEQRAYLERFWREADVGIEGDDALQQGVRFNQYHLLQSVGRDGRTNIAAKGVTGEGYEGHYFWDTEIYVFPFFLFSRPEVARALLQYRYSGLPKARERARQMSHERGALYPWRTIAGEECSAYYPAGTAQYHINADVAYSIRLYLLATGDFDFIAQYGAEIVLETARIWTGIGSYDRAGRFCINAVTGPDEYTAVVNNNYYTNAMARMHMRFALEIAQRLRAEAPGEYARVAAAIGLEEAELQAWQTAADAMRLPYDEALGIHEQDDSFLSKKPWDFAATPKDKYPLLLHFHPLVIYRHQVCKQADVVLALLLLSDEFALEDKRRDFDFYERVTTHDSSLSSCIFSIIANEVGQADKAYDYFMETARLDLDNTHDNTEYGVHTAAMAGTWLGVAYGFGGMRLGASGLRFAPVLPGKWQGYRFQVHVHGALLAVAVDAQGVLYRLVDGEELAFTHHGQALHLTRAAPEIRMEAA
ncbi:family 65 glycosyl hydrolase [Massilia sp. KIM]|uniref:glycoside hydrolase family 65 protein n=1 Tax=Massilia sp. KIM TaxID=1955422 RepID=UPI00098E8825|nr:glycosyl hydrolase family 65 protein [Massilia sp. KIM]OON62847.1 family 65 glycosyl hydrolase [Massilia sp. KIM]